MLCSEVTRDKLTSSFVYCGHMNSCRKDKRAVLAYSANPALARIINDSDVEYEVYISRNHVAMVLRGYTLDGSSYRLLVIAKYTPAHPEFHYFFLEKPDGYDVRQAEVSPDETLTCVLFTHRNIPTAYDIQVYSRRPNAFQADHQGCTFELEYEIPGLQSCRGCPQIAFDPRYFSSRLGLMNVRKVQSLEIADYFTVYDLARKRIRSQASIGHSASGGVPIDLVYSAYSPDGTWAYCITCYPDSDSDSATASGKLLRNFMLFNSDSAQLLQVFDLGQDSVGECYLNAIPAFSRCVRKVALRHRKNIKVFQLPPARSLVALCTAVLLDRHDPDEISRLDVPRKVKQYLQFRPIA